MSPLVSILIPCRNSGAFVPGAINSALLQSWNSIEVIVVDDGFNGDLRQLVETINDPRLTLIHGNQRGAAAARNIAFAKSTGQFVLYLDADDLISNDHVAMLYSAIETATNCVALSEWDRFRSDPREAIFPGRLTYVDASGPSWLTLDWMQGQPMTQCGMALIPRSLIEIHGGWDERLTLVDDFEFFARILSHCAGVRHAKGARLYYRSAVRGSLSGQRSRKAIESQFLSLMLGIEHLLAAEKTRDACQACANLAAQFDYEHYPAHSDLREKARARAAELGGANIGPLGPPNFHRLRRLVGWRAARRVQRACGH